MPGTARFPGLDWTFDGADPRHLAEAVGHAWVQRLAGGSVTVVAAATGHPWWPVLREWLPEDAPLHLSSDAVAAVEPLLQRPFPPVQLSSLPRDGVAPWPRTSLGVSGALAWLAEREPCPLLPAAAPHPALAIALAAIASWGWRVCWRVPTTAGLEAALEHIGRRQLPLHLVSDQPPAAFPARWWRAGHGDLALWLQHEWPTLYLPAA